VKDGTSNLMRLVVKHGENLLVGDVRKPMQKFVDRRPVATVVELCMNRHASSAKHPRSADHMNWNPCQGLEILGLR